MKRATTRKTKTTTNDQQLISVPEATATKDFELVRETVTSSLMPTGQDYMYGLRNKQTQMIELRGHSLALSIIVMQNQQQMMDKVRSGEMNGYASVEGKTTPMPSPGDFGL